MPVLVKYACGWIGLPPHQERAGDPGSGHTRLGEAFILRSCSGDEEFCATVREVSMEQGGVIPRRAHFTTFTYCQDVSKYIHLLINDGYRYREIRSLLQPEEPQP